MPGCVTEADTLTELYSNWSEVSSLWLEAAKEQMAEGYDPFNPAHDESTRQMALA